MQESISPPAYLSDAVVSEMQKGWDLNKLKTNNEETLRGKCSASLNTNFVLSFAENVLSVL